MKLSKTSAHATLALAVLAAQEPGQFLQAREIARHIGVPTVSALKILQTLTRQRLIQSQLGRSGGYCLSRSAMAISLLEVVEAIDGPISGQMRINGVPDPFSDGMNLLQSVVDRTAWLIREQLAQTTIADVASRSDCAVFVGVGD